MLRSWGPWTVMAALAVEAHGRAVVARAQAPRPMTVLDLAELPRVLDPQLSPDGTAVCYVQTAPDWTANRAVGHLWRRSVSGGAPVQLTRGDTGETNARWAPDGQRLLYLARAADGSTQIFLVPAGGGEARALSAHATSVSAPAWAPDGTSIYFIAANPRSAAERERAQLRDDVYAFEANDAPRHLWRVSVPAAGGAATGAAAPPAVERRVTDGPFSVSSFRLSADGRTLVTQRGPSPLTADAFRSEIWVSDADGGRARALTSNRIEEVEAQPSPDGTRVLFLADANARLEPYYGAAVFVVPAAGGTPQRFAAGTGAVEHAAWSADGRTVLAVVNQGVSSNVARMALAPAAGGGALEWLTRGDHSIQFWSVTADARRMTFQIDEPERPGDVWTMPADGPPGGHGPSRVTGVYDALAGRFALPRQEKLTWRGVDGVPVEGILFYPLNYAAGRRSPLMVQLHGGPAESDKFGWGPGVIVNYVPVLTARGYAVLRPNYRGSAGYGDAFLRDVVGHYFNHMHTDVLAGVDELVRRGVADPDRLGLMGWSAGGHLTNKLITVTTRFKAASSTAGAADWISFFAQTDTRSNRVEWFGTTPWDRTARLDGFLAQSPVTDAHRVRTPTLFLAGEADGRVPMAQSVEMYRAVQQTGTPTAFYVAPREGHQWGELRHQIFKANVELAWFEDHVRGVPYEAPPVPPAAGATPK